MSDILARLNAAGVDPMLIAEVAMEMGRLAGIAEAAARPDQTAEKRRAYDRERKREIKAAQSTGIPPESAESAETAPLDKEKGTQKEINPPRTHTHETPARKPASFACPDGVDPRHWQDFLTNRKRKRCVDTPTARSGVLNDLAKHSDEEWPPGRLVEHAAARGWASINYPDEGRKNDRGQRFGNTHSGSRAIDAGHGFIEDGRHH